MKKLLLLAAALSLTTVAHPQEGQLTMVDGGELALERYEPDVLAGVFRRGDAVARFESRVTPEFREFVLLDHDNNEIVRAQVSEERVTVSILSNRVVANSPRGESMFLLDESSRENLERAESALVELSMNETYGILPNLAIELIHLGIVGGDQYPAAQFIHGIAFSSVRARGERLPVLPWQAAESACQDLSTDPNTDVCYGMCGNGCTCWWPVCKTCCGCEGCHTHDWTCRITDCENVKLTRPQRIAYRAACYTFASFWVPLQPCHRYETGERRPPC